MHVGTMLVLYACDSDRYVGAMCVGMMPVCTTLHDDDCMHIVAIDVVRCLILYASRDNTCSHRSQKCKERLGCVLSSVVLTVSCAV